MAKNQPDEASRTQASQPSAATGQGGIGEIKRFQRPSFSDPGIVANSRTHEVRKGNTREAGGYLHSPAYYKTNALGTARFLKDCSDHGTTVKLIDYVRAFYVEETKCVHIVPTDDEDPDRIEVTHDESHMGINLIDLLGPLHLTVEFGYKEFYKVEQAKKQDKIPYGIKFSLGAMVERVVDQPVLTRREKAKAEAKARAQAKAKALAEAQAKNQAGTGGPTAPQVNQPQGTDGQTTVSGDQVAASDNAGSEPKE